MATGQQRLSGPPDWLRRGEPLALGVREFTLLETVAMALIVAVGLAFLTWLLAGYYERRGGFGKK